jgi:hypothetical protein
MLWGLNFVVHTVVADSLEAWMEMGNMHKSGHYLHNNCEIQMWSSSFTSKLGVVD